VRFLLAKSLGLLGVEVFLLGHTIVKSLFGFGELLDAIAVGALHFY